MMCTHARLSGFRHAMAAAGLAVPASRVVRGKFTRESGVAAGMKLLDSVDRPTAIFASNDMEALGVYEAARRLGLGIPDDLSVVGFDDIAVAGWMAPSLTTVRQPIAQMAVDAIDIVLRPHEGALADLRRELSTTLVVRESTARTKSF